MLRLVLSSVRHNAGRYLATLVAIVTGVGFYTAVGFISDRVIDSLEGNVDAQYGNVDVAVIPEDPTTAEGAAHDPAELRISQDSVDRLLALPGIEGGAGILTGSVAFLGDDGRAFATGATGRLWVTDPDLDPLQVDSGEAPTRSGQIAVDRGLADDEGLEVGDDVTLLTLAGKEPATIVGITSFGDSDALDDGGTVSISEADAFDWLNSGQHEYETYYLRGSGDQQDLVDEADAVVPSGFRAQTGDDFRDDQRETAGTFGNTLKKGLQAFAILALLVGGFVIYNTFSVIVAQRLRELAVLAAIGATPRQLKRSLRLEGLAIGVVGSVLGVVAGFVLTLLLDLVLRVTGNSLPGSGTTIGVANVVGGLVLGTVITVLSVMIPARRAARTEPIEAMRDAAVESNRLGRTRGLICLALVVLGLAATLVGTGIATIGLGLLAFMAGVFVGAPYIAKGGARLSRPLLERVGMEGRLAVDNSIRNPKRTATTANALLIGVFLVTLVAVAGNSMKDFAVGEVNKLQSADYLVTSTGGTIDPTFVSKLEQVPDVSRVAPFRREPVTIDGEATVVSSGDLGDLTAVANVRASAGSLDDLGPGKIAVLDTRPEAQGSAVELSTGSVQDQHVDVGSTVALEDNRGHQQDFTVVALIEPSLDSVQVGSLLDPDTFDSLFGQVAPTVAFLDVDSGAQSETKDAINDLADLRPDITVQEGNAIGQLIGTIFDFLIKAVTGLLLMSVVIALIGIINTMSLSILERRRELGLLRIIGMTDNRVRRMVTLESALIAFLGTLSGLISGLVVALALVLSINRLSEATISPSVPYLELVGILVLGVALGVLAALVPARRSTRLPVLDAIAAG
ncbi:ABC transporter permease [Nocardioides mangrovi]|uniref:ABC transporter permease n=1 Tax=Nocardioides mangrovi TaxID=2874580 RepID=A0ABS7UI14_9ACTN|nr:ABC transporter permease [Nocardioides mangrovi]MBZ5740460.1 ABC transporter permease [Nocardioides mangrovi]